MEELIDIEAELDKLLLEKGPIALKISDLSKTTTATTTTPTIIKEKSLKTTQSTTHIKKRPVFVIKRDDIDVEQTEEEERAFLEEEPEEELVPNNYLEEEKERSVKKRPITANISIATTTPNSLKNAKLQQPQQQQTQQDIAATTTTTALTSASNDRMASKRSRPGKNPNEKLKKTCSDGQEEGENDKDDEELALKKIKMVKEEAMDEGKITTATTIELKREKESISKEKEKTQTQQQQQETGIGFIKKETGECHSPLSKEAKNPDMDSALPIKLEPENNEEAFECKIRSQRASPQQQQQQELKQGPAAEHEESPVVYEEEELPQLMIEELNEVEKEVDAQMRASGQVFLQHVPCYKLPNSDNLEREGNIPRCRECRTRNSLTAQHTTEPPSPSTAATGVKYVNCRFLEFRRLQYNRKSGDEQVLEIRGFPNPYSDPKREDMIIWQPDNDTEPTAGYMDVQVCRFILLHVADQFCYLWRQEVEALKLHENPRDLIAWKKAVQGVREICDVCDTTLFNYHWTCEKCGFGLCLDCLKDYKAKRKIAKLKNFVELPKGRDEFYWLLCTGTKPHKRHDFKDLMLTQIIAGDALNVLGKLLHEVRALWQVPQLCRCSFAHMKYESTEIFRKYADELIRRSQLAQHTSASSMATQETYRIERMMKEIHIHKVKFAEEMGMENYIPAGAQADRSDKDPIAIAYDDLENIRFERKSSTGLRRFLPSRTMTKTSGQKLAPGVPHHWLCDGKLLHLTNPIQPDNRKLFQEVWKRGQPVMISEVAKSLDLGLWHPDAFCRDFGHKNNDLINCLTGNLLPNQPMRLFWEGFQSLKKRMRDSNDQPMLLKLKDWPPGDDFAEILPTRYNDLMRGLPMPEYTLRTGNLNLASCLPKMFVPPDLGPKMYNAYGSALHPDKGTTNLHLDISDAVNIMVYVGIPEDDDCGANQMQATQKAIDLGGCDYLTRARVMNAKKKVIPGALWHIFPARDADKIRDFLNHLTLEKGFRLEPDHDPIHDQNWYLDDKLRRRLFKEYGVEGYPIVQCLGDAVFIPAGAPHQVQNLHNCIKVAEDFVSPENITHCYHLSHEFRRLSQSHTNHEDKLQIKNIIFHAIKDCCHILTRVLDERLKFELAALKEFKAKGHRTGDGVQFKPNLSKFKYN